jgi:hypothetical protein
MTMATPDGRRWGGGPARVCPLPREGANGALAKSGLMGPRQCAAGEVGLEWWSIIEPE